MYMVSDLGRFDDGVFPDEDVVAYFEWVVGIKPAMQTAGRAQDGSAGDVGVSSYCYCDGGGRIRRR